MLFVGTLYRLPAAILVFVVVALAWLRPWGQLLLFDFSLFR